jgi:hypothetical protein
MQREAAALLGEDLGTIAAAVLGDEQVGAAGSQ